MTQDEIIKLAMEYGFTGEFDAEGNLTFDATFVEAVAEAVAKTRKATLEEMIYEHPTIAIKKAVEYAVKEEREACAKLVEPDEEHRRDAEWGYLGGREGVLLLDEVAKEIRARGNKA